MSNRLLWWGLPLGAGLALVILSLFDAVNMGSLLWFFMCLAVAIGMEIRRHV